MVKKQNISKVIKIQNQFLLFYCMYMIKQTK